MNRAKYLWIGLSLATLCFSSASPQKADKVLIVKHTHTLQLLNHGTVFRTYSIAIGRGGLEPKVRKGDHRTPEGNYIIDFHKPNSQFYRALHVSYPNEADRKRASKLGVEPGGDIMIHGIRNGLGWLGSLHRQLDWTDGCIAVTDNEIDEIWNLVPDGTPVEIQH